MKNVLIFDISNLMMRSLFSQMPSPTETEFDLFKLTFMNSFMKTIKDNKPDRVIAVEDSESWRKEIYPLYKANRAAKREQSAINFDAFFPVATKFIENLSKSFKNIPFIKIPRCEADDIIAVIVKNHPDWKITNVSSDKDFYQLFAYSNYSQFNGVKREYVECLNPQNELILKIILGDKGDNIPSLKKGVGIKTAQKILDDDLHKWLDEQHLNERYEENTKLISFDCIPKDLEVQILKTIDSFEYGQFDAKYYFKFIQMSGLAELMKNFTEHSEIIKSLN